MRRLVVATILCVSRVASAECDPFAGIAAESAVASDAGDELWFYGSDGCGARAFSTPWNVAVSGGFGALYGHTLSGFDWQHGATVLGRTIANPVDAVSEYGWRRWLRNEIVPSRGTQAWNPNYGWHLVGGGMRTYLLKEYFASQGAQYPTLYAWLSTYAMHLSNELLQAVKYERYSEDAVADLFIFDVLGKLVYEIRPVRELASGMLHLRDWTFQTQWNPLTDRLLNNGQLFWVRAHVAGPLSVSAVTGELVNTVGITWELSHQRQVSAGVGLKARGFALTDQGDSRALSFQLNAGLYYSVDDNVYAMLTFDPEDHANTRYVTSRTGSTLPNGDNNVLSSRVMLNLYPGFLQHGDFRPGITIAWSSDALFVGLVSNDWPIGLVGSSLLPRKYADDP
ncbi:MAG: hypothetical protein AAB426_10580 [Myxococcota bacterium]